MNAMGKRYLSIFVMAIIVIFASRHGLATFQQQELFSEDYIGRARLHSASFPLSDENIEKNWLRLDIDNALTMPKGFQFSNDETFKVKGIYITGWVAGLERRMEEFIQLTQETEINTFVIDVKDDSGIVSYLSSEPMVKEVKSNLRKIKDVKALLERLKKENIYVIGRIATFKDPLLAKAKPERALELQKADQIWADTEWTSAFNKENWEYNVAIAREALELGFDEIQFDYVRFPALGYGPTQVVPNVELTKEEAINSFLRYAKEELAEFNAPISADIYGVVTSIEDVGIGQRLETLSNEVDIISPMIYPSHYSKGVFKLPVPEKAPYETIYFSMQDAIERLTRDHPVQLRPWLQDFSLKHSYGVDEVRGQIQALYDLGIEEWLLWNPRSRYTTEAFLPNDSNIRLTKMNEFEE